MLALKAFYRMQNFRKLALSRQRFPYQTIPSARPDYRDVQRNLEKARTLFKRLETIKRSQTQTPAN
jgi:hypothetical protein